jgi:membrane peptidoglycan carboxypeptidase
VISSGTATLTDPHDGIQHFGKTGTTDSEKDTWFVGSSSKLTTAVWVGNVSGATSIRNTTISGTSGGDVRNLIWRDYMADADGKYGGTAFPAPTPALVKGGR